MTIVTILRRTVNAFLTRRTGLVRCKTVFLTHGIGLVRPKVVDSTTRPFLSTSGKSNLQQEDEIKGLKDKIAEQERDLLTALDSTKRSAIRIQIAANTNLLSTLKSQQGHLPHIFPFSFPIFSITPYAQLLSTH